MNDKLDEILDLLRSQNEMIKDIHDYVKEVTSEKYIGESSDHYINPNRKHNRKQTTYVRRPSNKACPNYEYGDDNFENRRRCIKEKNTQ